MKILQVNCVYKRGSTGKIVDDIHTYLLEKGFESIVCYGRGQKEDASGVYKVSSELEAKIHALYARTAGIQYSASPIATNRLQQIIEEKAPDVVHLHCINGYFVNIYRLLDYLKHHGIRTVLTLHAEFMHTGSCGHAIDCDKWKTGCGDCPQLWDATKSLYFDRTAEAWQRMADAFLGFDNLTIISVSRWLEERAKQSPILKDKVFKVVENGIDTSEIFYPRECEALKHRLGILDEKVILHTTANFNSDIKGGKFVIELARRMQDDKVKFIVVGKGTVRRDIPKNMIMIGHIDDQNELARYYSMADLTLLTSRRETFSMPCAESLACGTPVVGFKAGGPETIALKDYSEFVDYGDIESLEKAIMKCIDVKKNDSSLIEKAKGRYSRESMYKQYESVYLELMGENVN